MNGQALVHKQPTDLLIPNPNDSFCNPQFATKHRNRVMAPVEKPCETGSFHR